MCFRGVKEVRSAVRPGGLSTGGSERVRNGTRLSKRANRELPSNEVGWLKRLGRYCWQFKREVLLALIGGLLTILGALTLAMNLPDFVRHRAPAPHVANARQP